MSPSASLTTNASPDFSTCWLPRTGFCEPGSGAMKGGAAAPAGGATGGAEEVAATACAAVEEA
ncbi:hypothetical protein Bpla01_58870 [Burkholderia plantarii]|nr:hypothetical protein Bpla01_58870 [Burkholderia plantarii]